MSLVDFTPYQFLSLPFAKGVGPSLDYVSVLKLSEIEGPVKGPSNDVALFYADVNNPPMIWTVQNGHKAVKDISVKKAKTVTHVVSDGPFIGIFLLSKKGVEFVLLEYTMTRSRKLQSKSQSFTKKLNELVASCYSPCSTGKKMSDFTREFFIICNVQLRYFANNGALILAVLVRETQNGTLHLLIGCLTRKLWRRCDLKERYAVNSGIYIGANASSVTVLRCTMDAPVRAPGAPTVTLPVPVSLSAFNIIEPESHYSEAALPSPTACAFYEEVTFSLLDQHPPLHRTFQSLEFSLPLLERHRRINFPVLVESTSIPLFSFSIQIESISLLLQFTYSSNNVELIAECYRLPTWLEISNPLSIVTMQVQDGATQSRHSRISFILTKDLKLVGFNAGSIIQVQVSLSSGVTNDIKSIQQHMASKLKLSPQQREFYRSDRKAGVQAIATKPRLMSVGERELLCIDGAIGVFLHLRNIQLEGTSLHDKILPIVSDISNIRNSDRTDKCQTSFEMISDILSAENVTREELAELLLQQVIPIIRRAATREVYTFEIERVFMMWLELFSPVMDTSSNEFQKLAYIMQYLGGKTTYLAPALYTADFFTRVAEQYYNNHPQLEPQPHALAERLEKMVHYNPEHSIKTVDAFKGLDLGEEVLFFLDGLIKHLPLLSFAKDVVRRCMILQPAPIGNISTVVPKKDCGGVVHAMGLVLLAAFFNVPLYIGVDSKSKSITWSCTPSESLPIDASVSASRHSDGLQQALVLAVDLLCVRASEIPHSLCIPIIVLAMQRRQHGLNSLLEHYSLDIVQNLNLDCSSLCKNTKWLQACAEMLSSAPSEVLRALIQREETDQSPQTGANIVQALCYAFCSTGLPKGPLFFNQISQPISQEICTLSIAVFIFSMTDKLVAACNGYARSFMRYVSFEQGHDRPEALELLASQKKLFDATEQTLAVWARASTVLLYKLDNIGANYHDCIARSLNNSVNLSYERGTVVFRILVLCFRILVLVYYSQVVEQALGNTVVLCESAVKSDADINESHPAVRGCFQALQAVHLFKDGVLPIEKCQEWLLQLVESAANVCVADANSFSAAPWCFFFERVLSLSSLSHASTVSLQNRHSELSNRLLKQITQLPSKHILSESIRRCITQAETSASFRPVWSRQEKQPLYFVFSYSRDSSIPQWFGDEASPKGRYLISSDWTQRLWNIEAQTNVIKSATHLLLSRIEEEALKKASPGVVKAEPELAIKQNDLLFDSIRHIFLSTHPAAPGEGLMACHNLPNIGSVEKQKDPDQEEAKEGLGKEVAFRNSLPQEGEEQVLGLGIPPSLAAPNPLVEPVKADKIGLGTPPHPSEHAPCKPTSPTLSGLTPPEFAPQQGPYCSFHKKDDTFTISMGEDPALSDTATTKTTITTDCLTCSDGSCEPNADPVPSWHESNHPRYEQEASNLSRVKLKKKSCHHHHYHHHCHGIHPCCRSKRRSGGFDSEKTHLVKATELRRIEEDRPFQKFNALALSPALLDSPRFHIHFPSTKAPISPQPLRSALRPPPEPPRNGFLDRFHTPVQQLNVLTPPSEPRACMEEIAERGGGEVPSLLTFSHHRYQQSHGPRVQLYSAQLLHSENHLPRPEQGVKWLRNATPSPFLDNITTSSHQPHLEPPPLPSTQVFQKPPPLLQLRGHVPPSKAGAPPTTERDTRPAFLSCTLCQSPLGNTRGGSNNTERLDGLWNRSNALQQAQSSHATSTTAASDPMPVLVQEPNILAQVPREAPATMPSENTEGVPAQRVCRPPISEYCTDPMPDKEKLRSPPTLTVKQSFLTTSEMCEFRRYVDNLVAKKVATPPLPVPSTIMKSEEAVPAPNKFLFKQQQEQQQQPQQQIPLNLTDTSFRQKTKGDAFQGPVFDRPQAISVPFPPAQSSSLTSPRLQHGLSAIEQAQLVRETIKQKNELINLNRELAEVQLRAAQIGRDAVFHNMPNVPKDTSHAFVLRQEEPTSPLPSHRQDAKKIPTMSSVQVQTQPFVTNDASVQAVLVAPPRLENVTSSPNIVTVASSASITNTISDLERLNTELKRMSCSTDVVEKALHEARQTIERYETIKATTEMGLGEAALLNSLRSRVAGAENRLMELQRCPFVTQVEASDTQPSSQIHPVLDPDTSARYAGSSQENLTQEAINMHQPSIANAWEKRFLDRGTNKPENPNRNDPFEKINLIEQVQSFKGATVLCNTGPSNMRPPGDSSLGIKQAGPKMPDSMMIAPWCPYRTDASPLPLPREHLSLKSIVPLDANTNVHAIASAGLTDKRPPPLRNCHEELPARQPAIPHVPHETVMFKDNAGTSPLAPSDLYELYQAAPRRPSEVVQKRKSLNALHPRRSSSASERPRKTSCVAATRHHSRSRAIDKANYNPFYMYLNHASTPRKTPKGCSRAKMHKSTVGAGGYNNTDFSEAMTTPKSKAMVSSQPEAQPNLQGDDFVFMERQRRGLSDNIEKRIQKLEREFA